MLRIDICVGLRRLDTRIRSVIKQQGLFALLHSMEELTKETQVDVVLKQFIWSWAYIRDCGIEGLLSPAAQLTAVSRLNVL